MDGESRFSLIRSIKLASGDDGGGGAGDKLALVSCPEKRAVYLWNSIKLNFK